VNAEARVQAEVVDVTDVPSVRPGVSARELLGAAVLVGLAALVRLVALAARGSFDADQGTEMLVLLGLDRDHVVPLLGPQTSIGGFHHGVLYYWLLAPAAFLSDADPTAVVAELAILATLAIVPVWWLARAVGGPAAGVTAAIVYAVSATGIAAATMIWNPSLVPLPAALTIAAAWKAATSGRERWWLVAAGALAVTTHAHVLGATLAIPLVVLFVAARRSPALAAPAWRTLLVCVAIVLVTFTPLLVHDAGHGWTELRALAAFATGGGEGADTGTPRLDPISRVVLVTLRLAGWPLTGLVTLGPLAPLPALLALVLVLAGLARLLRAPDHGTRLGGRFLGLTLVVSIVALAIAAPSLQTVVPGLPVDQYHAFVDPVVIVLAGLGIGGLVRRWPSVRSVRSPAAAAGAGVVVALVAWNAAHWPPTIAPDGGWPAVDAAAARIAREIGPPGAPVAFVSLPAFKPPDAYEFALARRGLDVVDRTGEVEAGAGVGSIVTVCDDLLRNAIGARCGGLAEDAQIGASDLGPIAIDRFEAAPGRWIGVYRTGSP
jgi:hypothetical protein